MALFLGVIKHCTYLVWKSREPTSLLTLSEGSAGVEAQIINYAVIPKHLNIPLQNHTQVKPSYAMVCYHIESLGVLPHTMPTSPMNTTISILAHGKHLQMAINCVEIKEKCGRLH